MSFAEKVGLVLMAFESTANISANATDSNLHQLAPLKFNGSSLTVLSSLLTSASIRRISDRNLFNGCCGDVNHLKLLLNALKGS